MIEIVDHLDNGALTLKPYNLEYTPKTYPTGAEDVTILGVIVQMRRTLF
ncbi:hypothetical protein [Acetobacterium sp.]